MKRDRKTLEDLAKEKPCIIERFVGCFDGGKVENDLSILSRFTTGSRKQLTWKCGYCGEEFQRDAYGINRALIKDKSDDIYCYQCSRTKVNRNTGLSYNKKDNTDRLSDWLDTVGKENHITISDWNGLSEQQKLVEKIDGQPADEESIKRITDEAYFVEPDKVRYNRNKITYFRCLVHRDNYAKEICNVCRNFKNPEKRAYRLDCCRKGRYTFSLQDWCLIFNNFNFIGTAVIQSNNGSVKAVERLYTGAKVKTFYNRNIKNIAMEDVSYSSKEVAYFKCSKTEFVYPLRRVTLGMNWCKSPMNVADSCSQCKECNRLEGEYDFIRYRVKDSDNLEEFWKRFNPSIKDNPDYAKQKEEIEKYENEIKTISEIIKRQNEFLEKQKKLQEKGRVSEESVIKEKDRLNKYESDKAEVQEEIDYLMELCMTNQDEYRSLQWKFEREVKLFENHMKKLSNGQKVYTSSIINLLERQPRRTKKRKERLA